MSKILAFDTSNNTASVAISNGQRTLAFMEELQSSSQAEFLLSMIESALKEAKLSYNDLDYAVAVNGPGSFTGIRIGLAALNAMSISTQIKCTTVTNFEIAYFRAATQVKEYDKIIILLNAYRGEVYMQTFEKDGSRCEPVVISNQEAALLLCSLQDMKVACAGSGLINIYEQIYSQVKKNKNIILLPRFARVKAIHICRYFDTISKTAELRLIEPLYIRQADAVPKKSLKPLN